VSQLKGWRGEISRRIRILIIILIITNTLRFYFIHYSLLMKFGNFVIIFL